LESPPIALNINCLSKNRASKVNAVLAIPTLPFSMIAYHNLIVAHGAAVMLNMRTQNYRKFAVSDICCNEFCSYASKSYEIRQIRIEDS
jgi:hypothetical protein